MAVPFMFMTAPKGMTKLAVSSSTPTFFTQARFSGMVATLEQVAKTKVMASFMFFRNFTGLTRPQTPTIRTAWTTSRYTTAHKYMAPMV